MPLSASAATLANAQKELAPLLLAQAVKITGRLAHDFGNCLTGILGFAELSAKQVADGSLAQRYLKEVCQTAQDAAAWLQRLHALSRGRPPCFKPADLATVVRAEEDRLKPLLQGAELRVELANFLPALSIDCQALRQIMAALLDNAREAVGGRGAISITACAVELGEGDCQALMGTCEAGPHADIAITDTGAGLPAQLERELTTNFFFSTKPRHRGLGLATVRALLQAYNGGLRFGPHPEKGATIHVLAPVAAPSVIAHDAAPDCSSKSVRGVYCDHDISNRPG